MSELELTVRFLRHGTDPDIPCVERELVHVERCWRLPPEQCALVLVDCWAEHFIASHAAESARIMRETLRPVVDAARRAGVAIVHAPSPTYVEAYPQWVAYADDGQLGFVTAPRPPGDDWPPPEFRARTGEYAAFARPAEPRISEWVKEPGRYRISETLAPQPGDWVIADGDQLHRLLHHRRLLHLFYAGFATNMCILHRDYGTRAMGRRGYNIILLRDCTTGIECRDTVEGQWQTRSAIYSLEVMTGCSALGSELLAACNAQTAPANAH